MIRALARALLAAYRLAKHERLTQRCEHCGVMRADARTDACEGLHLTRLPFPGLSDPHVWPR